MFAIPLRRAERWRGDRVIAPGMDTTIGPAPELTAFLTVTSLVRGKRTNGKDGET